MKFNSFIHSDILNKFVDRVKGSLAFCLPPPDVFFYKQFSFVNSLESQGVKGD